MEILAFFIALGVITALVGAWSWWDQRHPPSRLLWIVAGIVALATLGGLVWLLQPDRSVGEPLIFVIGGGVGGAIAGLFTMNGYLRASHRRGDRAESRGTRPAPTRRSR